MKAKPPSAYYMANRASLTGARETQIFTLAEQAGAIRMFFIHKIKYMVLIMSGLLFNSAGVLDTCMSNS